MVESQRGKLQKFHEGWNIYELCMYINLLYANKNIMHENKNDVNLEVPLAEGS